MQPVSLSGVEAPKLKSLSKEGIEFDFGMKIRNPNKMSIYVYPSSFDAMVNDIPVGTVHLTKKVKIKANSDNVSEFNIKSDFSKLGLGDIMKVLPIVSSKSAAIYLKGEVKAGKWYYKKKFPVELKKTIPLSK
jgi:LEA14-like dessication related protein